MHKLDHCDSIGPDRSPTKHPRTCIHQRVLQIEREVQLEAEGSKTLEILSLVGEKSVHQQS